VGIVVDASVTLSWCFPDEQTLLSLTVLDRLNAGEEALVPAFWAVEVLNALLVGEHRSRIRPEETRDFLDQLVGMAPTVDHAP
jgi:predicted nucleic acid-binding protein